MDFLPTDLVYECLFFLDWKEYYEVCKYLNINLKLNVYFRNYLHLMSIDEICNEKEEYLDIVKFLHSINKPYTESAINWASYHGHLEIVKFLHSINAPFTKFAINFASRTGQLDIIKFLHSINA